MKTLTASFCCYANLVHPYLGNGIASLINYGKVVSTKSGFQTGLKILTGLLFTYLNFTLGFSPGREIHTGNPA